MNAQLNFKWWLDAALFVGFIAAFLLDVTGLAAHQWLGVAAGAAALYHLATHWAWVKSVSKRFLDYNTGRARLYYQIDGLLALGFIVILFTGLVISSWLDLNLANYSTWLSVHIVSSMATLLTLLLKIGLHWRWVVRIAAGIFARPPRFVPQPAPAVLAPGRREFLKVMGIAGALSIVALSKSLQGLALSSLSGTDDVQGAEAAASNTASSFAASSSASSTCSVRCGRRCSYPGHCRRYTDANNNGRCDLGECL